MVKDNVKRSKPESGYAAADDDLAFSRLSDEELLAVLRFLPAGDLVHGVMAVSPKLSRLARDREVWEDVVIDVGVWTRATNLRDVTDLIDDFLGTWTTCVTIHGLEAKIAKRLDPRGGLRDLPSFICAKCPRLRELRFHDCREVGAFTQLESLCLQRVHFRSCRFCHIPDFSSTTGVMSIVAHDTRLPIEKLHPRVLPKRLATLDLRKPTVPYDRSGVRILDRLQRQMPNCRVLFDPYTPQTMAPPSVPWSNPINQ